MRMYFLFSKTIKKKVDNILTTCCIIEKTIMDNYTKDFALKIRKIRRKKKISQEQLWYLSGVSLGSIKRFERTGDISFASLVKILKTLDLLDEFKNVL